MSGRKFIMKVIEMYKSFPCLWQTTHVDYHSKHKRKAAIENLVLLFKTQDASANNHTVLKKIGSMRSCFKKEQNKVRTSLRSSTGSNDVHVPKLWYYNSLMFLAHQERPRRKTSTASSDDTNDMTFTYDDDNLDIELVKVETDGQNLDSSPSQAGLTLSPNVSELLQAGSTLIHAGSSLSQFDFTQHNPLKMIAEPISDKDPERLDVSGIHERERHSAFGVHVAEKLRFMPENMVVLCQKIINDAIFQADIGHLNLTSRIVTDMLNK